MSNFYAAIGVRDFRLFTLSRLFVTLAIHLQGVVVGWQIYVLTNDPLALGLIGLAEAIPSVTVALYAGHVADITDRKIIIQSCESALCLCSAALLFFTLPIGEGILRHGVWPIYTIIFISGVARGFYSPAAFSFMPQLISRNLYQNAISWNTVVWQCAAVCGPMLGGLLYGFFNITVAYAADMLLMMAGLTCISLVPNRPVPTKTEEPSVYEKIKAGVKFVFSNQILLAALSLDLFAVLFGGAVALLPIFAKDILLVGKTGLGILRAAPAVGAFLTAFLIIYFPINKNVGKILLWCVAGFGFCMIGFGLSKSFMLSIFLLALSGAFDSVSVIVRSMLVHTLTPENMKGRVSAVNTIFIGSSNEIGAFESGLTAKLMGTIPSVIFGGVMTLGVVATTAWKAVKLRMLEKVA